MDAWQLLVRPQWMGPAVADGSGGDHPARVSASAPFGFAAGLVLAVLHSGRAAGSPKRASAAFTTLFRGIPDLLSLFIVYFGLQIALNWVWSYGAAG